MPPLPLSRFPFYFKEIFLKAMEINHYCLFVNMKMLKNDNNRVKYHPFFIFISNRTAF